MLVSAPTVIQYPHHQINMVGYSMEQNKKEIIVDDLDRLRECLVQGYKKVTVTEELSFLIVSTPALVDEFYIHSQDAREKSYPTPYHYDKKVKVKLEKIAERLGVVAMFLLLAVLIVILFQTYFSTVFYYIFALSFFFTSIAGLSVYAFIEYKQHRSRKNKYYYKAKYDKKKGILSFKKKKYYFFAYLPLVILGAIVDGI